MFKYRICLVNKYGTRTGVAELMFDQSKYSFFFKMIVKYR